MRHSARLGIILALLVVAFAASAAPARTVDLLTGLQTGELWAQLHGGGDTQVSGVIGRTGAEPLIAQIDPGTLYLTQRGGFGGSSSGNGSFGQRGGRQGQLGVGGLGVNLTDTAVAQVTIPTACTNLGLPAPTPADVMTPVVCPDERLVRLALLPDLLGNPRPAVQLAVWAITDNPRPSGIRRYLREVKSDAAAIGQARELLIACGVGAQGFRLFR